MRVVCWNIERGYQPEQTVSYLKSLGADIYMLYELDRGVKRTKGVDMFKTLQEGLGLPGKYVTEFREVDSMWRRIIPWGGPGGGEIGNAIFSRYPLQDYKSIKLPYKKPLTYEGGTLVPELFQPRKGARKAQICSVMVDGTKIGLASAHLELWRSDWQHRSQQLSRVLKLAQRYDHAVVAGDFNNVDGVLTSALGGSAIAEACKVRELLETHGLTDPFSNEDTTAGRLGLHAKIDWVSSRGLVVQEAELAATSLSDHACLVVDYQITSSS